MSRGAWELTVRDGPRVERQHHGTMADALLALEARAESLVGDARREEVRFFARRIDPAAQVAVRLEIAGPRGVRGGVDLRGDGSAEAFTGRWRRQLVEQGRGETAVAALRRALSGAASGG